MSAGIPPTLHHSQLSGRQSLQRDVSYLPRTPAPTYRHAGPSAPCPWMDFDAASSEVHPLPEGLVELSESWRRYPQNLFGNWTQDQITRSRMLINSAPSDACHIYKVDVMADGRLDRTDDGRPITVTADSEKTKGFWEDLQKPRPEGIRVRALFIDNLSLHVLQMLGTKYNIEPFFFSSSMNWIPSHYQEDVQPGHGDHITVVMPFIQTVQNRRPVTRAQSLASVDLFPPSTEKQSDKLQDQNYIIDTQAPLVLPSSGHILLHDLLAIHIFRTPESSTIISYHPDTCLQRSSAKRLQSLFKRAGDSVHWSKIFARSRDPTFVFLVILWYALYAWDEAFEVLHDHINNLESSLLTIKNVYLFRELHKLQAHLLHYKQLLRDFRKSVIFVQDTPNPAMDRDEITPEERRSSAELMRVEAYNLLSQIERLEEQRCTLSDRLNNVQSLIFATASVDDTMQKLTEATMRDSAAMKQISYLTMVFLPASLIASVFGMNVVEINPSSNETLAHYAEATITLTLLTAWLVGALQAESSLYPKGSNIWRRLAWPIFFIFAFRLRRGENERKVSESC